VPAPPAHRVGTHGKVPPFGKRLQSPGTKLAHPGPRPDQWRGIESHAEADLLRGRGLAHRPRFAQFPPSPPHEIRCPPSPPRARSRAISARPLMCPPKRTGTSRGARFARETRFWVPSGVVGVGGPTFGLEADRGGFTRPRWVVQRRDGAAELSARSLMAGGSVVSGDDQVSGAFGHHYYRDEGICSRNIRHYRRVDHTQPFHADHPPVGLRDH